MSLVLTYGSVRNWRLPFERTTIFITYRNKLSHLSVMMNKRWIQLQKFGIPPSERLEVVSFAALLPIDHAFLHQILGAVEE